MKAYQIVWNALICLLFLYIFISKSLRWWIVPRNLWYNVMQNGLLCSFVAVTDIFI